MSARMFVAWPDQAESEAIARFLTGLAGARERAPWQDSASCAGTDPNLFFPPHGGTAKPAKRVCGRCRVRAECLEYALGFERDSGDEGMPGVYGGTDQAERRAIRDRERQDSGAPGTASRAG